MAPRYHGDLKQKF